MLAEHQGHDKALDHCVYEPDVVDLRLAPGTGDHEGCRGRGFRVGTHVEEGEFVAVDGDAGGAVTFAAELGALRAVIELPKP